MQITEERFKRIIEKYVLPLIPIAHEGSIVKLEGSPLEKTIKEGSVQFIKNKKKILFLPVQSGASFCYCSEIAFDPKRVKIVTNVLNRILSAIRQFNYQEDELVDFYIDSLCSKAVTIGISSFLNSSGTALISKAIFALEAWTIRTYEGRKIPFGIVIDFDETLRAKGSEDFLSFLNSKYSASFTDGVFSAILLNNEGKIIDHIALPSSGEKSDRSSSKKGNLTFAPARFEGFAKLCENKRIGLISLSNGDILVIKGSQLVFAKREGKWLEYNYSVYFRPCLENVLSFYPAGIPAEEVDLLAKSMYVSILDSSFAHTGACIAITDFKKQAKNLGKILHNCLLLEDIDTDDKFIKQIGYAKYQAMCAKHAILRHLTGYSNTGKGPKTNSFIQLSQKLRAELLSMDGAVVIDKDGGILAVGAILSVKPGSEEGGRLAAARELSRHGVAVKVSEDGAITCLYHQKLLFKIG